MVVDEDEGGERGGVLLEGIVLEEAVRIGRTPRNEYMNGGRGGLNRVSEAVKRMLPFVESLALGRR